jgi:hypothetical protein
MGYINSWISTGTGASGSDYGEKGIEQGSDWGTPVHGTPSPTQSMDSFNAIKNPGGGGPAPAGQGKSVEPGFSPIVKGS